MERIEALEAEIKRLHWEQLPWWKRVRTPPPE
jgi:hypothetical protein